MNIAVVGSGSWGISSTKLLAGNGHNVTLWSFFEEEAEMLRNERENKKLLPGVRLPDHVRVTSDISCVKDADMIVCATPSFAVAGTIDAVKPHVKDGQIVVCLSKGLDRTGGFCVFAETIAKRLGDGVHIVALTGPSHAEEVGRGVPTLVVAASSHMPSCQTVQDTFMNERFRVYTTPDIVGAQLGGALKNVVAFAAGVCDGMNFGDNTKAALMTRGLTEIARLGVAMGGRKETFTGLSGLGDLIVTCTSMHSRNRRAGILVGQGVPVKEAMERVGAVVEGYYAVEAGYTLSQKTGIEMPICSALYRVLYENADIGAEFDGLMRRRKRHETEDYWMPVE